MIKYLKRIWCALQGHKHMKFHASTCVQWKRGEANAEIGVTCLCPNCGATWCGDIVSGMPINELRASGLTDKDMGYGIGIGY